jgi:hypothetical protein
MRFQNPIAVCLDGVDGFKERHLLPDVLLGFRHPVNSPELSALVFYAFQEVLLL